MDPREGPPIYDGSAGVETHDPYGRAGLLVGDERIRTPGSL
jgi:hypothetical protein